MQFRSLHSLARRTLAAGATSALALTLFNAVQPSLDTHHRIGPGTIKDVAVTLVPTATASPGAGAPGAVDNAGSPSAESATLPLRGAEPGAGLVKAASATGDSSGAGSVKAGPAAGQLISAPVAVGKARFVGVSWPAPAVGPPANLAGKVWLRARTDAGWSGWRVVEPAADGPDANTAEYRRSERVYSDGLWLDAGTAQVQIRVDRPAGPAPRARPVPAPRVGPALAPEPGPVQHQCSVRRRGALRGRGAAGRGAGRI